MRSIGVRPARSGFASFCQDKRKSRCKRESFALDSRFSWLDQWITGRIKSFHVADKRKSCCRRESFAFDSRCSWLDRWITGRIKSFHVADRRKPRCKRESFALDYGSQAGSRAFAPLRGTSDFCRGKSHQNRFSPDARRCCASVPCAPRLSGHGAGTRYAQTPAPLRPAQAPVLGVLYGSVRKAKAKAEARARARAKATPTAKPTATAGARSGRRAKIPG